MKMNGREGKGSGNGKEIICIALAAIVLASIFGALAPTSARDGAGAIERGDIVYQGEYGLDISAMPNETDEFGALTDVTGEKDDDVHVEITSAGVIFDMPRSATIGEEVTIRGTVSAGDEVDILVDDGDIEYFDDVPVDEDNEFEVEWDTEGLQTGSYTIDAYIDCPYDSHDEIEAAGIDEDGNITIRLIVPVLDAEQLRNVTAEGDDYIFRGIATGVDEVDYILVGPEGWKTGCSADILGGILKDSTSVIDDTFMEDVTMTEGLDTGVWVTLVLAPGRDGMYETGEEAGELTLAALGVTAGKNQDQIVAIIEDATIERAGSDDLLEAFTFSVESPFVDLEVIEPVVVGEPLIISGTTNRESGTLVVIWTTEEPTKLADANIPRVGAHVAGAQVAYNNPTVIKGELVNLASGGTRTQEIAMEAEPTIQVVGNDILITTVSGAGVQVVVNIQAGHATFYTNKGDWSSRVDNTTGNLSNTNFIGTMPADGTLELVITSATNGGVTIRAGIDANANGCIDHGELTDTGSVSFRKSQTIVETSTATITIGDMATILGLTDAGVNQVAIFVDNVLQQIALVEAGYTFEWDWDTSLGLVVGSTSGIPLKPGLVTIKVFEIHPVDVLGVIGDGLDTRCGGDGATPGGGTSTFYDIATGNPRHADAYTWILAVDNVSTPLFPPVITEVKWPTADTGVFSATIDTTDVVPGTYTIETRDGDGNCDTVTVEIVKGKTAVSISTDKTSYTMGNTMHVGLGITNPGDALPVRFAVWLEQPGGGITVVTYTPVTLPAGLDYSNPHFMAFRLPRMPAGIYRWHAALIKPSGPVEIISHDTAEWEFVSTRAPTEDIARTLEQTTIVIDFGE